jgi:Flp pilus assembly protein TadG
MRALAHPTVRTLHRLALRLRHFVPSRDGVAAVEFAMVLPVMVLMYLGMTELTFAVNTDRKITLLSRTLADLTGRATSVDTADMDTIFNAASSVMAPYSSDQAKLTVSSIVVSAGTGNRAVVSANGAARVLSVPDLAPLLAGVEAVQVDGHYPELAVAVLTEARRRGIPTLIDAGSWKPVTPSLLPLLDVVVCSADFHPPGVTDVAAFLAGFGVRWIAISRGAGPLLRWTGAGFAEQPVPAAEVVDTLGAGDVLHGALTLAVARRWPLTAATFTEALDEAAAVATRSCSFFGTRAWMSDSDPA